jgi:CrcB protein
MTRFLLICLGGAVGTGARYLLSGWLARAAGPSFPFGTLAVNVLGSFLLGLLMQVALTTELVPPTLRLALTTGLLGGFTTYSTFNYETLALLEEGAWLLGGLNLAATAGLCLLFGALGVLCGRAAAGSL